MAKRQRSNPTNNTIKEGALEVAEVVELCEGKKLEEESEETAEEGIGRVKRRKSRKRS